MIRISLRVSALLAVLIVTFPSLYASPQNSNFVSALWIAETEGALKVATSDGATLFEIPAAGNSNAIGVDEHRGLAWVHGNGLLHAYDFSGTEILSINIQNVITSGNFQASKVAGIEVNPMDGMVWLAAGNELYRFGHSGNFLGQTTHSHAVDAISMDVAQLKLWVGGHQSLAAYDHNGQQISSFSIGSALSLADMVYDANLNEIWVTLNNTLRRYDESGVLQFEIPFNGVSLVAPDGDTGLWVSAGKNLYLMNPPGSVLFEAVAFSGGSNANIVSLVVDADKGAWVANHKTAKHFDIDSSLLNQVELAGNAKLAAMAIYEDQLAPSLQVISPLEGSTINTTLPTFEFTFDDVGIGVDEGTLNIELDGAPLPVSCSGASTSYTCNPISDITVGSHQLSAIIGDFSGNVSSPTTVNFTVEPLDFIQVRSSVLTSQAAYQLNGSLYAFAALTINGASIPVDANNNFSHPVTLAEGENRFAIVASGTSTNHQLDFIITLDSVAPFMFPDLIQAGIRGDSQLTVTGNSASVETGAIVEVTNTNNGLTVLTIANADGSFTVQIAGNFGDTITLRVIDNLGNASAPSQKAILDILPSSIDPTVTTTLFDAMSFIYDGVSPVQIGVSPGAIEAKRASAIKGVIAGQDGTPLSGVQLSVIGKPEYGYTVSRDNGAFDLVVNGGGVLTLNYEKVGFLPIQRRVNPSWLGYTETPPVVMMPLDSQSTVIDLTLATPIQVALGSTVTDADGTRQAVIMFPQGTQAELLLSDNSLQSISTLTVRSTEYSNGNNRNKALPGELPENVGNAYVNEISVDEAIAAGAREVRFNQPVTTYVDNFLGLPVGGLVPSGYYDKVKSEWMSSDDGRIIAILSIANGMAELDVDGSGLAANATTLASLGITDAERQQLATLYAPGKSLWRTQVTHLTPWGLCWPYGPPADAEAPVLPEPEEERPEDCEQASSIIECQNQILGESIGLTGLPFDLNYRSNRTEGRKANYRIEVPLSGGTLSASVQRIHLKVEVSGRTENFEFAALPDQTYTYEWDGTDGFGRRIYGSQRARVSVGYAYKAALYEPLSTALLQSFGAHTGNLTPITTELERMEVTLWQRFDHSLNKNFPTIAGLGGWSLGVHHQYDVTARMLSKGDGTRRAANSRNRIIDTVAGSGTYGYAGDGGAAKDASLRKPKDIAFAPDGTLYIADSVNNVIRRVDTAGIITTVVGTGVGGFSGDGGPAVNAQLNNPVGLDFGPDGSLYISDANNNRIRKVDPSGIITTLAGNGTWGFSGDGGAATSAALNWPRKISVADDGSVYIADYTNYRIRKVDGNGIISTVVGSGSFNGSETGDGGLATQYGLDFPEVVTVAPNGNLYVGDSVRALLRVVTPDGVINTVAGQVYSGGYSGDGGLAKDSTITDPYDIAVDEEGNIYLPDIYNDCIRRIGGDGIIATYAGDCAGGPSAYSGDGGPAKDAGFHEPWAVAIAPDGSVYIADTVNNTIRRVDRTLPGLGVDDIAIASESGRELFHFDVSGRHLRTLDTTTNAILYQFDYDSLGYLSQITDRDGKVTQVERDTYGLPTAIVSHFGHRTELGMDADGYLSSVANPNSEQYLLGYSSDGLLSGFTDPRNNTSTFTYDQEGRLKTDVNAVGGGWTLTRTDNPSGHTVAMTTAEGRSISYQVNNLATGDIQWINTNKDGTTRTSLFKENGETTVNTPEGTVITIKEGPDPRFGMERPEKTTITTTPAGLLHSVSENRSAALSDPDDKFSHTQLTHSVTINERTSTAVFDTASSKWSMTSAAGRLTDVVVDANDRPLTVTTSGIAPISYTYNDDGNLTSATQEGRTSTYDYYSSGSQAGYLGSATDALSRLSSYSYDLAGRLNQKVLPGNRDITFNYDANGNVTGILPPGRPEHAYDYTNIDQGSLYTPPAVAGISNPATQYTYNLDKQLELITHPNGQTQDNVYDSVSGKITSKVIPRGSYNYSYNNATGQLNQITAPDAGTLIYTYDGHLPLSTTWAGTVDGSVSQSYNNDFVVSQRQVNGANSINFSYDNDLLLTNAGAMTLSHEAQNGLLTGTNLAALATARTYNTFAELSTVAAQYGASTLYNASYSYDDIGRITTKVETVQGVTVTYSYGYDAASRLNEVKSNGTVTEAYTYDSNGNRLSATLGSQTVNGNYDEQDRLSQYGNGTYTYTDNGELTTKTESGQITQYNYDLLGNLITTTMPDTTLIEYVIDGQNRRIGKKINGSQVQGFLYKDQLNPVVELDAQGAVVSRFVYGTKAFVPDYMIKGSISYRIISDHLGSVRLVVNTSDGSVAQRVDYNAYGLVISDSNPGFQPFGFAGGIYDGDTKLVRFGARDYDAGLGRFIQSDPIGLAGGLNTYVYVASDPINFIDPLGLWSVSFDAYAGAGGGVTFGYNESTGGWFGGGRVGFGVGGGFNFNASDKGPEGETCSRSGTKFGTFGSVGASVGPLGGSYGFEGGRYTSGGSFSKEPSLGATVSGLGGKGVSIGGAIGVQTIGF